VKKNIVGSLLVAGMAAITIGAFNLTDVSAAGVATTFDKIVRMYKPSGELVTNRALGAHTPWQVGDTKTINGETMYQVSTAEYVKASDVSYDANPGGTNTNTDNSSNNSNIIIKVNAVNVFDDQAGSLVQNAPGSIDKDFILSGSFKVGRIVQNDIGTYYQVSEHGWVKDFSNGDKSIFEVIGTPSIEHDDSFSPLGTVVLGKTADQLRQKLVDYNKCNPDALKAVPDHFLLERYAYFDNGAFRNDDFDQYAIIVNQSYRNVGGYIHSGNDSSVLSNPISSFF
jgi:hypothetical protein